MMGTLKALLEQNISTLNVLQLSQITTTQPVHSNIKN